MNVLEAVTSRPLNVEDLKPIEPTIPPMDGPWDKLKIADAVKALAEGRYEFQIFILFPELLKKFDFSRRVNTMREQASKTVTDEGYPHIADAISYGEFLENAAYLALMTGDRRMLPSKNRKAARTFAKKSFQESRTNIRTQPEAIHPGYMQMFNLINYVICYPQDKMQPTIEAIFSNATSSNILEIATDNVSINSAENDINLHLLMFIKILNSRLTAGIDFTKTHIYEVGVQRFEKSGNTDFFLATILKVLASEKAEITPEGIKLTMPSPFPPIQDQSLPEIKRI